MTKPYVLIIYVTLPLQHAMVLEKIKYLQSEKDNELAYLSKELSSIQQKCSLLEMNIENHQAENMRLKRELSEIEMAHNLEREKVSACCYTILYNGKFSNCLILENFKN